MGDRIQLLVFIVTPRTRPGAMREVKNSKCLGVSGLCDNSVHKLSFTNLSIKSIKDKTKCAKVSSVETPYLCPAEGHKINENI